MTIAMPMPITTFANVICDKVGDTAFTLLQYKLTSGTSIGDMLTARLAVSRWQAEVSFGSMRTSRSSDIQALCEVLEERGGQFNLFNKRRPYPKEDPKGVLLGARSPGIHEIGVASNTLRVNDLPSGYVLSVGDMLSVVYSANPVRVALYRVCERVVAAGNGITPAFEVAPFLRAGMAVGNAVTLKRPVARMQIMPGSFTPGQAVGNTINGMGFTALETRG
jgi:hypothetical protein